MRSLFGSGGIYQLQHMVGVCVVPWRSLCDGQDVTPVGEIWDMERMEGQEFPKPSDAASQPTQGKDTIF